MSGKSTFTQKMADHICEELIEGKSLRTLCAGEDMPTVSTVCKWLVDFPTFSEQYARAREIQADTLFDEILDIADESTNDKTVNADGNEVVNHEAIQRARLRVDTRKWMAGKLKPKKYGEKQAIEHSSPDGSMTPIINVNKG